jgi:hypothetical protein
MGRRTRPNDDPGAVMTTRDPDPPLDDEVDVIVDGVGIRLGEGERSPEERDRIIAWWRDLFREIRRRDDAHPGTRRRRDPIDIEIAIVPGTRTTAQDAALAALWADILAHDPD